MVAITEKYRRLVEKRSRERRRVLLPMRVSVDDRMIFEGATLDVSRQGIYFRMPGGERLSVGDKVRVEMTVPAELSGGSFGYHLVKEATVVRVENGTLTSRLGCHRRDCGVAVKFTPDFETPAARRSGLSAAVA